MAHDHERFGRIQLAESHRNVSHGYVNGVADPGDGELGGLAYVE
jgi:hypothetical protein